jgi:hypothetical protein
MILEESRESREESYVSREAYSMDVSQVKEMEQRHQAEVQELAAFYEKRLG